MTTDVAIQQVEIAWVAASREQHSVVRRVLVLKSSSDLHLPIWVGVDVADAINARASGVKAPRPQTHDLLEAALTPGGHVVERALIDRVEADTFYAEIWIRTAEGVRRVDARPSDAIAVAVGCGAPIFVADAVLSTVGIKMDLLSGTVASAADRAGVLEPDADDGESLPATIDPGAFEALGLTVGDQMTAWVPRGPVPPRAVMPAMVESTNGQIPSLAHDLTPAGVPVTLHVPAGWYPLHPGHYQPFGSAFGELVIWVSVYDAQGLDAVGVLDRVFADSDGAYERLDEDGSFTLAAGFEATMLTRANRELLRPPRPELFMDRMFSLEGATVRWMSAIAGDRVVIAGVEAVDWDRGQMLLPMFSRAHVETGTADPGDLTEREVEVLNHIADGATNAQIAERLDLSPHTVGNHVRSILAKLEVANRTQATSTGFARGIIEDGSPN